MSTDDYLPGTIYYQSRDAKSKIASGASFTIKIAQETPSEEEEVENEVE